MANIVCEWGLAGIEAWRPCASVFVIVDILSFSTVVSVAVDRGASVIPFAYGDAAAADREGARQNAIVASPRGTAGGQVSLLPVSLKQLQSGSRILLPSPNGSRLSLATGDTPTICGCLRNASAVARLAATIAGDGIIAIISAGERWPDQTLRPAIEDWIGAGAMIAASTGPANAEAKLAAETYRAVRQQVPELVRDSRSGRELTGWGFGQDVSVALEIESSPIVPMMTDGAYMAVLP